MTVADLDRAGAGEAVLTDTHAHLSMVFKRGGLAALASVVDAYDAAWKAATATGTPDTAPLILEPGTLADDLPERVRVTGRRPWLRFAAGIWPDKDPIANPKPFVAALEAAVVLPDCRAIGECGLDYHWMHGSREDQRKLFEAQIDLAVRYGKPLIIHSREAHEDTVKILESSRPGIPVVIHCFGYDADAVRRYLNLGCYISFAGNLTYPSSAGLREACALVPPERFLMETDSPYMAPIPERGKICTPRLIGYTYAFAAKLRGVTQEDLARTVTENARTLFG